MELKLVGLFPFLWFQLNSILNSFHLSLFSCLISYLNVVSWTICLNQVIFFFFWLCGMEILFLGYNWLLLVFVAFQTKINVLNDIKLPSLQPLPITIAYLIYFLPLVRINRSV